MHLRSVLKAVALSALLSLPTSTFASTLITNAGTQPPGQYGGTVGYRFHLDTTQPLDALGVYAGYGLTQPHGVGLWLTDGTLLAQASVGPAGVPDSAGFIYSSALKDSSGFPLLVNPTLTAGTIYVIGAALGPDNYHNDGGPNTPPTFGPGVTSNLSYYSSGSGLSFPNNGDGNPGYIGPNAEFGVLPEPASASLLVGAAGLLLSRRRRSL